MRVAVTAKEPSLDAEVDPRFGRCSYFLIVETGDLTFEVEKNPNVLLESEAGTRSARLMAESSVDLVLMSNCGPRAHQTLSEKGIRVVLRCSRVVREVVKRFTKEQVAASDEPNVPAGFGTGESLASLLHGYPH